MTAPPAGWPAGPLYVVEPASSGHRLWYVRLLADAAAGSCTLLTTPPVPASVEFELHLAGADLRTETVTPAGDRGRGWYRAALARAAAVPGSSVVMPDAEAALLPLLGARAGGVRAITVVLMRTTRGPGLRGLAVFVAKLLLVAALRLRWRSRLRAFALLPPGSELRPLHRLAGLRAVHDPVRFAPAEYDPAAARDRLGLPTQGQVFAVIGPLSDRKSVPEIIDAWRSARRPGVLLLAQTDEVTRAIDTLGRILGRFARDTSPTYVVSFEGDRARGDPGPDVPEGEGLLRVGILDRPAVPRQSTASDAGQWLG